MTAMNELTRKQRSDLNVLCCFIGLSCRMRHGGERTVRLTGDVAAVAGKQVMLCPECADLLGYAAKRLRSCPLDPKPSCKKCQVHCYRPDYRERIREVMAWSGKRMILRGRLDLIAHYFF
jgi:hypothetical protein